MSGTESSWFSSFFSSSKKKNGRQLREEIKKLTGSSVLDDAGIEDAQVLSLTREDLNELFPGIKNFQLRRKITDLLADKNSATGPENFARVMKNFTQKNRGNDAAVQDVLMECLQAFKDMEEQLKAAQASIKPYIAVLKSLTETSVKQKDWAAELNSTDRQFDLYQSNSQFLPVTQSSLDHSLKVFPLQCGHTFGADVQILTQLRQITVSDLQACQLIFVFCPVTSRAGTDIEEALKKIPNDKAAVLVTMHHTFKPDLVCPSTNALSSHANIVDHVNVLFYDSARGLLQCPANENAIAKLQSVVNQFL